MTEYFEDEDVIIENSPLDEYLSTYHLNVAELNEKIPLSNTNDTTERLQVKSFTFDYSNYILNLIKQKLIGNQILCILKNALLVNILIEVDDIHLEYLIDSRFIHWNSTSSNRHLSLSWKKIFLMSLIMVIVSFFFEKRSIGLFIILLIMLSLTSMIIYGLLIRWISSVFFGKLAHLSIQSRQTILLIQELLSVNQGYSRLVHIKDNSAYDCSKSFNEEFLMKFSKQVHSVLSDLLSLIEESNRKLLCQVMESGSLITEIPWFQDDYDSCLDFVAGDRNFKQPMSELKTIHNQIQLQFAESIKMIVLLVYSLDNHPNLFLLFEIMALLHNLTTIIQELMRCKQVIQIKTKSNLCCYTKRDATGAIDVKIGPITDSIQSLELHLFEISEFLSQFHRDVIFRRNASRDLFLEWLTQQRESLDKGRKHIDALDICWNKLIDACNVLQNQDRGDSYHEKSLSKESKSVERKDEEPPVMFDSDPVIEDEVIEGVPENVNGDDNGHGKSHAFDPFEERYLSNAKALLNELQSVIEVRAEDWKKREKVALERRAAEGKFVFNRDTKPEENVSKTLSDQPVLETECQNIDSELNLDIENVEYDLNFRRSLGEMILRQRENMLMHSEFINEQEECFGD